MWNKFEKKHIWELFSVLAFMQVLDVIFSYITFSMGGAELNPIMIWMMVNFGTLGGMIIIKLVLLVTLYIFLKYKNNKIRYVAARNLMYVGILPYIILTGYHIINITIGIGII